MKLLEKSGNSPDLIRNDGVRCSSHLSGTSYFNNLAVLHIFHIDASNQIAVKLDKRNLLS